MNEFEMAILKRVVLRREFSVFSPHEGNGEKAAQVFSTFLQNWNEPEDLHDTILLLMFGYMNDRERMALEMRYRQGLTYREIGEKLGISTCLAQKAERSAIEKLTVPPLWDILILGANQYTKDDSHPGKIEDLPLESIGFSVRTYNVLKRAGYNTVGELAKVDDLLSIPYCWKATASEIVQYCKSLGVPTDKWEEKL